MASNVHVIAGRGTIFRRLVSTFAVAALSSGSTASLAQIPEDGRTTASTAIDFGLSCGGSEVMMLRRKKLKILSDSSLTAAIVGKHVQYLDMSPRTSDARTGERFGRDGSWTWEGGRANEIGRFEVMGNAISIVTSRAKYCRQVFLDQSGNLYVTRLGGDQEQLIRVVAK